MTRTLATLVRLRRLEQDEAARALAEARHAVDAVETALRELAAERARETPGSDPRLIGPHADWLQASIAEERRLGTRLAALRAEEEERRRALGERAGERKAVELVVALRAAEAHRLAERKRQLVLDEAAVDRAGRSR